MGQFNQQLLSKVIANLDRLVDELNFQKLKTLNTMDNGHYQI